MTGHTPRFTARAPDPHSLSTNLRLVRCTTVAKCDRELVALAALAASVATPETMARIRADQDAVLDRRTRLAFEEATVEAIRVANEP